ncbi:hypothetical protein M413DRAFT_30356 [Hebeloma cylindrosporum]|uniref:T6SS Phospholipase effector Tle1-like catalytic domain-containing protein n=1 Tax=Hebeloma cylindrosporum TaxID=76867 RepID=A0A0C3C1V2_HEBCY|nr:hypothetical protein M413DRAFT_30356 [Hebeloma cylindrosporum h7]
MREKTLTLDSTVSQDQYPGFPKALSPGASTSDESEDPPRPLEPTVPPNHDHRTLVLCFDGTGDQFDEDNSNIVNFFSMLKKDDPKQQLVYYQAGIGTYTIPQIAKPMMAKIHKIMDTMVGKNLNAHVMGEPPISGGYEFLMQNYEEGDKIFLFGFSRGAYTARALAGMLHKVGLLPKDNHQQVPFAYKMYSREDETGWRQSGAFKKAFSIEVDIELVGVWDTVGSVGVIPKRLPFTTFNTHVKHFRHALALDEHRKAHRRKTLRELERQYRSGGQHYTDVEEVWFAGCHCDVGGGAVKNEIRNNLARIPLRWMIRECFKLKTGILFQRNAFKIVGLDHSNLWPKVKPRPAPVTRFSGEPPPPTRPWLTMGVNDGHDVPDDFVNEEEEDLADALSDKNDMLNIAKSWWILEYVPQQIRFQKDDDSWVRKLSINRGRGRVVPKQRLEGVRIHRTVQLRMDLYRDGGKPYKPQAKLVPHIKPTWID